MVIIKNIRKKLQRLGSEENANVLQRFFKTGPGEYGEGDVFLGVRVPDLRKLVKEYQDITLKEVMQFLRSSIHEERMFALLILVSKYSKGNETVKKRIYELYLQHTKFINSWDLVDGSAQHIVGAFLMDKSKEPLYRLAKSNSLWERRIAILSTFYFIKHHNFSETIKISKILLTDEQDLIHKAVGWMLREIGKRDITAEEIFLKKYYKSMPRTMLRYAIEKFPKSKRKKYLRGDYSCD
ncbi:MAG: DNA alkylation repair protein [Deltaproteobacteria bacterium]|nr:DNA alkylation repair protein [Deltaproteobacteria bacterium]MBW1957825.1 DNA alkylation repair protein [Deltaproteobacteria bacterium]MBW2013506.1 DNA alkylation repair protein [Deltaproteobacteria bacterium]MBW2089911.1 DNA alkylation repair protein [Deltaproteobacteria bacterium]MBW2320975.1 DNA alkylation repair protein [Deltaproteobacteria bacterium]